MVGNISVNNDQGDSYRSGIQLMDAGEDEFLCTRNVVTGNVCLDDQEKATQQVGIRIGRVESKCPDNLIVANSLGRHPHGPFGGNRRGAAATAHNWTGDSPEDHAPVSPLIPVVGELPEPEARWHGRLVLLNVNDDEIPYVCRRKSGKLEWAAVGQ